MLVFPIGLVTVTVGLLPVSVPLHTTVPPVLGVGLQVSHRIVYTSPLIVPVKLIATAPLVGLGFTTPVGITGPVVVIANVNGTLGLVFPAGSVTVIVPVYVPSVNAGAIVRL